MNTKIISKKHRGFTLIELLVVIAIIGILSSVVLASVSSSRAKARDARRKSDLSEIKTALELYYAKCGTYFVKKSCTGAAFFGNSNGAGWFNYLSYSGSSGSVGYGLVFNGMMGKEAIDPSGKISVVGAYMIALTGNNYTIWATLERPTTADSKTLSSCALNNFDTGYKTNYCISN